MRNKSTVEEIQFNGVIFRRYPESGRPDLRNYYRCQSKHYKHGVRLLHREIWKSHNGPIPPGYHVHHKDGDPLNNRPENLECLPAGVHLSEHGKKITEKRKAAWSKAREMAAEWHGSTAGREWHSKHAKETWKRRKPKAKRCESCGGTFSTKKYNLADALFCSNRCKSRARRKSGADDIKCTCGFCGGEFTKNRFAKTKTCSRICGASLRKKTSKDRAGLQYEGKRFP